MSVKKIETEVMSGANDVGLAVKKVATAYKEATADGWQPTTDIPAILMASFNSLLAAFDGVSKSKAEFEQEPIKAGMGAVIPILEAVDHLRK